MAAGYDIHYPLPLPAKKYKIGLVVLVWNRANYLRKFLRSFERCDLHDTLVVFVDDCSVEKETQKLLTELHHPHAPIIRGDAQWHEHFQIHKHLRWAWDLLADAYGCEYLTNLDPDLVMREDWLQRVSNLHQRETEKRGPVIVSGFGKYTNIVLERGCDYEVKRFLGGANMFFTTDVYREIVRPQLVPYWDDYVVEALVKAGGACVTTKPSCIQHKGRHGVFSSPYRYSQAIDYSIWSRLNLRAQIFRFKCWAVGADKVYEKLSAGNPAT